MNFNAYIQRPSTESRKALHYRRQATDQLADALHSDGSSLMLQALKQGVLDPKQCCRLFQHDAPGFVLACH